MTIFENIEYDGHEQVVFCKDEKSGLKAIIAVHDTTLGPGVGGCRMWSYASEKEALTDALRLSKGMTYKNAMAGLEFGGGKAVIIGNANTDKSKELLTAYGQFVERVAGRYITAEDVGISPEDMEVVHTQTKYVAGLSGTSGDPSPFTAYGVYQGIKASVEKRLGRTDLKGLKVAIQGVGHVGYYLCKHLFEAGAQLFVCDINQQALARVRDEFNAVVTELDDIYDLDVDVYAPCALGATINDDTISRLKCTVVAGAANNQLAEERHGEILKQKNILYAPDYVINAGGIINISFEKNGYNADKAHEKVSKIYQTLKDLYDRAESTATPTNIIADQMALEIISQAKACSVMA